MHATLGETFEQVLTLSAAEISAMATRLGDHNPIHHDAAYASTTRFGGIIACGPHISGLLMALTATHFAPRGGVLGLHFHMHFRAATYPDRALVLRWEVVAVEAKASLGGEIVTLHGTVTEQESGKLVMRGEGQVLLTDAL